VKRQILAVLICFVLVLPMMPALMGSALAQSNFYVVTVTPPPSGGLTIGQSVSLGVILGEASPSLTGRTRLSLKTVLVNPIWNITMDGETPETHTRSSFDFVFDHEKYNTLTIQLSGNAPSVGSRPAIILMEVKQAVPETTIHTITRYVVEPTPTVTFVVHKNVYAQGEPVTLTITNTGTTAINLPSIAPWWVERFDDDNRNWVHVYSPIVILIIPEPIEPGQSMSWSWDQSDSREEQVSPGTYRIGIHWDGMTSYTQEFEIRSVAPTPTPTPTPPPDWVPINTPTYAPTAQDLPAGWTEDRIMVATQSALDDLQGQGYFGIRPVYAESLWIVDPYKTVGGEVYIIKFSTDQDAKIAYSNFVKNLDYDYSILYGIGDEGLFILGPGDDRGVFFRNDNFVVAIEEGIGVRTLAEIVDDKLEGVITPTPTPTPPPPPPTTVPIDTPKYGPTAQELPDGWTIIKAEMLIQSALDDFQDTLGIRPVYVETVEISPSGGYSIVELSSITDARALFSLISPELISEGGYTTYEFGDEGIIGQRGAVFRNDNFVVFVEPIVLAGIVDEKLERIIAPTPKGDFSITINPKYAKVSSSAGGSVTYTITISAWDGFDSPIEGSLTVTGSGFNETYALPTQYPPYPKTYSHTVNIPSGTLPGTYTGAITAIGGGRIHTDSTTLEVPGFGAIFAIVGLLAVACLIGRKKR